MDDKKRLRVLLSILAGSIGLIILLVLGSYYFAQDRTLNVEEPGQFITHFESEPSDLEVRENIAVQIPSWILSIIVFLSIATTISVSISFYLYRWRRILIAEPHAMVPEEWGKYLKSVGTSLSMMSEVLDKNIGIIAHETRNNTEKASKLVETFLALQKAIDVRDEEVKRLKRGYDAEIFRRFLIRFIRVDQLARDYLKESNGEDKRLEQITRLLEDALDDCGVELFEPPIGGDSRKISGIEDHPKVVATKNEEDDFHVIEVLEPGYRLFGTENEQTIVPARVLIAVYEKQE